MAPRTGSPTRIPTLENFYNVSEAAVRLKLRPKEEDSHRGEKWLRDGVNGKYGTPFPHHRMAGQLLFSDSNLAEIAALNSNKPDRRGRHKRVPAQRRPARQTSSGPTVSVDLFPADPAAA